MVVDFLYPIPHIHHLGLLVVTLTFHYDFYTDPLTGLTHTGDYYVMYNRHALSPKERCGTKLTPLN